MSIPADRYYREKDGDREREKRRDLLCKKFWCAPPSVSLRFLSALLIFDYHPLMRRFWVKDHLLLLLSPPSETLKSWSRSLREKFWISVGPFNQVWKQVFVPKRDDTPALCRPDSNRFLQLDKHIYIYIYRFSCTVVNKAEIIEGEMEGKEMVYRFIDDK